jgi:hypothetical protein
MQPRLETESEIWCGACKRMEPKANFGRRAKTPSGLNYVCKKVVSERNHRSHKNAAERNNERHRQARKERKASPDAKKWAIKHLLADARRRVAVSAPGGSSGSAYS